MPAHPWYDLNTHDFAALDPERTIAVLPVAAVEQHGPHLPVGVDTIIAEGMVATFMPLVPDDISVLVLPIQAIGKSNEHLRSSGTLTLSAETALRAWVEIGEGVARAGVKKLAFVTSHGGNVDLCSIVARELRVRCQMLVAHTGWGRFGAPEGLYTDIERQVGIHGGDMETSLMLHFRPETVRMEKAENFAPTTLAMMNTFRHLRPTGPIAFGWIAQDVHAAGVAGDASLATTEKGRLTAEHQAKGLVELIEDMAAFTLDRLA